MPKTPSDILQEIVLGMVDIPDAVSIETKQDDRGVLMLIHADGNDVGRIIGRGGETINLIRGIIRMIGFHLTGISHSVRVQDPREDGSEPKFRRKGHDPLNTKEMLES